MTETKQAVIARAVPWLWGVAGLMFLIAAWLGESIAFVGIGVMFILLGVGNWLGQRKKASK